MTARHRRPDSVGARLATAAVAAVVVSAVAAGTVVLVHQGWTPSPGATSAIAATGSASPGGGSGKPDANGDAPSSPSTSRTPTTSQTPTPPHLVAISPDANQRIDGDDPIDVTFDEPLAPETLLPIISPSTPGVWSQPTPTSLRFTPTIPFVPDTKVTVEVPAGMTATNGGTLTDSSSASFRIADGSLLRLQELLAELGYLPVRFTPASPEPDTAAAQGAMAFDAVAGDFSMRFDSTPQPLAAMWKPDEVTPVTTGAIMAFENAHHLDVDGLAGPAVWGALLDDAVSHTVDPQPYTWAWTTMKHPETLRIWSDGAFVFTTKANTGIAAAPTPTGSWPVFARYRSQTMKGTNPDGTKYNDPGVPYINYFHNGDAIHGFKRASYGTEQSLGCVELPYDAAAKVWSLIDYGTVVTITAS